MLRPAKPRCRDQPIAVSLEELVPQDHFYRHLENKLDLSFVRDWALGCYAERGRPSVDPFVFFKLQLLMFFEGIRSERKLIAAASLNLAQRWYLGYALDEELPDHSSLTCIRQRIGMYATDSESEPEMDQPRNRHQPRVHGSGLSHPTGEIYVPGYRFGMYRWHVMDPIRFQQALRVTIQALGWWAEPGEPLRYRPGEDDIASTAFWYQTEPHAAYPPLPGIEALRVD